MNVTEKQKEMLLHFMKAHPDFGRGRIRSKGESKRQVDQLRVQVSEKVNCAGCGPQKTAKEWAKTWRDWKSNVLKKVAAYKSYAGGTGGGPQKSLKTSRLEDELLEFMSPDASGLAGIPEGGFGDGLTNENACVMNTEPSPSGSKEMETDWISSSFQEFENVSALTEQFDVAEYEEGVHHTSTVDKQVEQTATAGQPEENLQRKKIVGPKKSRKETVISLLKEKSAVSKSYKIRILELKEEKLKLKKEEIAMKKQQHEEVIAILGDIKKSIDECQQKITDICGIQYLE